MTGMIHGQSEYTQLEFERCKTGDTIRNIEGKKFHGHAIICTRPIHLQIYQKHGSFKITK
ncbi:hypothetical protein GLYMA_06G292600v4 [Glycine max]|uniref:Uncharacterized protein n=1 Tax=Glycine max TaxID=3847 RepID=K7KY33_SOYBN|nr:hypothetical protein JHK85_017237 [Glycine max]KAH1128109.1 hypothetical protein GYH30_016600 [Glycine max]KRH55957.1 hypothetical protein GLYMA_06G292600v4 [Glycine max]